MVEPLAPGHAPVVALIAGEDSGDLLGADLARALRARWPAARIVGVGGPRMRAAGVTTWRDIAELSVMGLAEVVRHLPRLLALRRDIAARLLAARPAIVVGIDAPDFNLGLEKRLKRAGIRTAHYVSPSVWAWREGRARKLGASADCVLCLFPMEPTIYARHGVPAQFTGHPLADAFPLQPDRGAARRSLNLPDTAPVLAVLPGSRRGEVARLGTDFLTAATRVAAAIPGLRIVVPAANAACHAALHDVITALPDPAAVQLVDGQAHAALAAADLALVASGTAALEALLAKCPMVVGYRIAPATYRLVRWLRLMRTDVYSLPNILAGHQLVPELMQDDCQPEALAAAVLDLWRDAARRAAMLATFTDLHRTLHAPHDQPAADSAAAAIIALARASAGTP